MHGKLSSRLPSGMLSSRLLLLQLLPLQLLPLHMLQWWQQCKQQWRLWWQMSSPHRRGSPALVI
jgi:hypothetical protein